MNEQRGMRLGVALVILGVAAGAMGLYVASETGDAVGWVVAVAGGLLLLAGLIGEATRR